MKQVCAIAALLASPVVLATAPTANAGIVRFVNDGSFHWAPQIPLNPPGGHSFDITQGPGQPSGANDRTLWYLLGYHDTSDSLAYDTIITREFLGPPIGDGRIARSPTPVVVYDLYNHPSNVFPPAQFNAGDSIGPTADWVTGCTVQVGSFLSGPQIHLGHYFAGVKFPMADGDHYGYYEIGNTTISWGYESQPGVPARIPLPCGTADFNCDGDVGTDMDIDGFFACLAGSCPPLPCTSSADFNGDGDSGTDADIESFFRVLGGSSC